jgi:hypothetical protein
LLREPRRIRLLLEYWARGAHNAVIRGKISVGLDRYRAAFRTIAEEVLPGDPGSHPTSAGIAAVAVSLIVGYPVQAIIDPESIDIETYLTAVQGIFSRLPRAA